MPDASVGDATVVEVDILIVGCGFSVVPLVRELDLVSSYYTSFYSNVRFDFRSIY